MELCGTNHDEVCHSSNFCPACFVIEDLEDKITELEDTIKELEDTTKDSESKIIKLEETINMLLIKINASGN